MQNFEQKEKDFEEQVDNLPHKPFKEVFAEIKPRLKKKPMKRKTPQKLQLFLATAASILVIITGVMVGYFWPKTPNEPGNEPEYRYSDDDITLSSCFYDDLMIDDSFLLDLSLLQEKTYQAGKHNETKEVVYFIVFGIYDDGISFREVEFYVILKKEYQIENSLEYDDLPNSFLVDEKTIKYSQPDYVEPFFSYYLSLEYSNIRYYFEYKTIEENDVEVFFQEFIGD